jgi:DNA repair exonuclease SbcCD ATPase subunit
MAEKPSTCMAEEGCRRIPPWHGTCSRTEKRLSKMSSEQSDYHKRLMLSRILWGDQEDSPVYPASWDNLYSAFQKRVDTPYPVSNLVARIKELQKELEIADRPSTEVAQLVSIVNKQRRRLEDKVARLEARNHELQKNVRMLHSYSTQMTDEMYDVNREFGRLAAENEQLRELLREVCRHIRDEYGRSWPHDKYLDDIMQRLDEALGY